MKNLFNKFLMVCAVFTTLIVFSCNDGVEDLENQPTVDYTTNPASSNGQLEVTTADVVTLNITANTPLGFNVMRVTNSELQLNAEYTRTDLNLAAGTTTASASLEFTISTAGEYTFEISAVDDENNIGTAELTITVTSSPISSYSAVLLGAQGNANEGFYNAIDNERYTYGEARDASGVNSSPVDFAYYYGASNGNSIASIDDGGLNAVYSSVNLPIQGVFGTRNSTRFRVTSLSPADFDNIESGAQLVAAADSELNTNSSATQLSVGSVIAFELDADRGGNLGLIKVTQINDTNGNGTITIEVKTQQL